MFPIRVTFDVIDFAFALTDLCFLDWDMSFLLGATLMWRVLMISSE